MAAVEAESSGSSLAGTGEHIADEAPAVSVPDMLASAEADVGEAPQTESPPLFSYQEAESEDLTAQPEPAEPVATVEQSEAPAEQIETLEAAQSIETEEQEEITGPLAASPPQTQEVTAQAVPASVEAEVEHIDTEVTPVDTETYEPTAPPMESALHVGEQSLDAAPSLPDELLPVETAPAAFEDTPQVEVASLAEVEAPNVEAMSPTDDAPLAAEAAPQVESEPPQPPDTVSDVAHDTFLTEITPVQPASTAAEILQAQPPQPQHPDPQTWAPPPPPPPPTPYGVPPIRANEDMWPSYMPSASADTDLAPTSDIDTTLVGPVAMPAQPLQPASVEQPYVPAQEHIPVHEAPVQPVTEDTQPQPFATEPVTELSPAETPVEEHLAHPVQITDGSLDLSALFDQMEIDTSERSIPRPIVAESEPPVEVSPGLVEPPVSPAEPQSGTPPRPQTVMPITITPTSSTQPSLGNHQQADGVSPYDASAWQAFSGIGGGNSQASTPQQQQTPAQEEVSWQQFAQAGAPDPYATGVGPADQPNAEAWQPAPGMPRPQRGTPEYDAMVRAALAQRGVSYTPPTSTPQAQPQQQPQAQPSWQSQPDQPRPKPGTPEYEEMVRAALAQRGIGTAPLSSPPSQPYQSPQQQPQAQPSWQPQPGQPRPKPGTPEYEEMVRQALAQRGVSHKPHALPTSTKPGSEHTGIALRSRPTAPQAGHS